MVDTNGKQLKAGTYLLVIDQDNKIYASPEHKAFVVHHSSFTGGKPVKFGGEMIVGENGKPKEITNASGHYLPTKEAFDAQMEVFGAAGIDTSKSKLTAVTF